MTRLTQKALVVMMKKEYWSQRKKQAPRNILRRKQTKNRISYHPYTNHHLCNTPLLYDTTVWTYLGNRPGFTNNRSTYRITYIRKSRANSKQRTYTN